MTYIMLFAAVAGVLGAASPSANGRADNRAQVRASWAPADSADSLWREARGAFSDGDWKRAADLFARIRTRFPRSAYTGDAHYYEAFALYKVGDAGGLRRALTLLETQGSRYAGAATVKNHEARSLATRIKGALARGGDATSAEDIAVAASAAGDRAGTGRDPAPGCAGDDQDERVEALNALLQMNAEQAMPILKKVMARRDKCSEVLRRKAVFLVSQKRTDDAADVLLEAARGDPDAEVREQSVFWLSQVSGEKAEQFLMGILKESKDSELQKKALFAISQRRSERSQQSLRDYAEREDVPKELRDEAIFWVGQRRSPENAQFLRQLFGRTSSTAAREKILFSLAQMKGFGNETFLLDQVANTKLPMDTRKQALFWAGQGSVITTPQLAAIYDKAAEAEMREQVIFVVAQRGHRDGAALDKLIEIARSDKDRELRKKAIFWLGQSKDPRAAKLLQEMIEK